MHTYAHTCVYIYVIDIYVYIYIHTHTLNSVGAIFETHMSKSICPLEIWILYVYDGVLDSEF